MVLRLTSDAMSLNVIRFLRERLIIIPLTLLSWSTNCKSTLPFCQRVVQFLLVLYHAIIQIGQYVKLQS